MIFFNNFAQNIDRGYTLERPLQGGSNVYPQSMFWSKNKKNMSIPAYPSYIKVEFNGVYITQTCFPDEKRNYSRKLISKINTETDVTIKDQRVSSLCILYIFFFSQFYVPFKLSHSYRDESIGRWGENRTRGKTT